MQARDAGYNPDSDKLLAESQLHNSDKGIEIARESSSNLRSRVKHTGKSGGGEIGSSAFLDSAPEDHGHSSSSVYILGVVLVLILFVLLLGIWKCL